MRFVDNVVIKKIAGTNVVIPIGQAVAKGMIPVELNEEEYYLVKVLMQGNTSIERLIEKYLVRYPVTVDEAKSFVDDFISDCKEFGYIVE